MSIEKMWGSESPPKSTCVKSLPCRADHLEHRKPMLHVKYENQDLAQACNMSNVLGSRHQLVQARV